MGIEQYREGKFSPLQTEIEAIRQEAIDKGENPDKAVEAYLARFEAANARLKEERHPDAMRPTERAFTENPPPQPPAEKRE